MKTLLTLLATSHLILVATGRSADITTHHSLTLDGARKIADAAVAYAKSNGAPGGSIAIVDEGGHCCTSSGGVPIVHEGQVVGAIGVSGAKSAQQDEDIAKAGVAAIVPVKTAAK